MISKVNEMIGQIFGRLKVIGKGEPGISKNGKLYGRLLCVCSCDGKEILVRNGDVKNGGVKSCGCLNTEPRIMQALPIGKFAKRDFTIEYFLSWIDRLRNYHDTPDSVQLIETELVL
jgi:hypothetical protein